MRRIFDDGDLAAESPYCLRHLHTHSAATEHEHALRHRLHACHLAVGPKPVELTQSRHWRHDRICTRRDHDVVGGVTRAVDLDRARPSEPSAASDQRDALICQPPLLTGVGVVGHHEVAPVEGGRRVDLRSAGGVICASCCFAGAQQRLRRDARPVGALATDEFTLDERDPQSALGERAGAMLSGGAATYDDHVVVVHDGRSVRTRLMFVIGDIVAICDRSQCWYGGTEPLVTWSRTATVALRVVTGKSTFTISAAERYGGYQVCGPW